MSKESKIDQGQGNAGRVGGIKKRPTTQRPPPPPGQNVKKK